MAIAPTVPRNKFRFLYLYIRALSYRLGDSTLTKASAARLFFLAWRVRADTRANETKRTLCASDRDILFGRVCRVAHTRAIARATHERRGITRKSFR